MKAASKICEHCGDKVFDDAPRGLCPACALETGFGVSQDNFDEANCTDGRLYDETPEGSSKILGFLGNYELLEEIGRGGQGVVYRARQKGLNRTVALKVIGLGRWSTKAHLQRFRHEAEAAASLDHPGIVPIYEIGESGGYCYFSMKLVEGGQLDEIASREPMSIRRTAELIAKLARTLHYAHKRGILHRDIKPGNILIDADGEPRLADFGLARLLETESTATCTTEVLGTPSYMAPEQAVGSSIPLTSATDVYGLGAALYHLLTGHAPFTGRTTRETVRLVLETEPQPPSLWNPRVDCELSAICLKCLEKDPQRRYTSALALAEDLERWVKNEPIQARRTGIFVRGKKWTQRNPSLAAVVASLAVLLGALGMMIWKSELGRWSGTTGIAVLPFENLSNDREDASFADGLQDDILTKLAKIAELKVISRTSVMQYRGDRNMRQIGDALRVSHVLEGSVRKTGGWLHVNAQLIDTRTDTHVWAEQYDRNLNEVFAIQSEIAEKVAEQLHTKISPAEKLALEQPPTADLTAFDLYSRAKNLLLIASYRTNGKENLLRAADLLNQAIARDPSFFQAYCQLASTQDLVYFSGFDHTPSRLAAAEKATEAAFRLRPDAGEAHVARAETLYRGYLDYGGASAELEIARQTLPNDPRVFELKGFIERRQGRWEESTRNLERAADLDPRNILTLLQIATSYEFLRNYAHVKLVLDRVLTIEPNDVDTRIERALVEFYSRADTRPLHQLVDSTRATNPAALPKTADAWLTCALAERDLAAAADALAVLGDNGFGDEPIKFSPRFVEGLIARMTKNDRKAQSAFTAARMEQEKIIQTQPDYGPALCVLGLIDAGLGRKEEALREARRAVELLPVEKDSINGMRMIEYFAIIAAWLGDEDLACDQLVTMTSHPSFLSYGHLKLMPFWDPLRGNPRFEKIVASLAPKEKASRSND